MDQPFTQPWKPLIGCHGSIAVGIFLGQDHVLKTNEPNYRRHQKKKNRRHETFWMDLEKLPQKVHRGNKQKLPISGSFGETNFLLSFAVKAKTFGEWPPLCQCRVSFQVPPLKTGWAALVSRKNPKALGGGWKVHRACRGAHGRWFVSWSGKLELETIWPSRCLEERFYPILFVVFFTVWENTVL